MDKPDIINNWGKLTQHLNKDKKIENDINYNKHLIKPCKMIACVGPTGCGKSNSLIEFLHRKRNVFTEIILFTGSTADEDLYNFLDSVIEGIQLIDNIDELPELVDFNDCDKNKEKLIIFDDMINLNAKEKIIIKKWFNSARKYGFTCIAMVQNWTDMPLQMRRNTNYIFMFKLKDQNEVNQILKGSNQNNIDMGFLRGLYNDATQNHGSFFNIDLTENDPKIKYRKNFIQKLVK